MMNKTLLALSLLGSVGMASLYGQALVLKDGTRVDEGKFKVEGTKITREITVGNAKAQINANIADIDHIDWPEVTEMRDAQTLLSEGKIQEAVATLTKARDFFKPFKSVKGSPYQEISFAYVTALDQAGDFDGLLKSLPEVESMKWSDEKQLQLRVINLNMARRTASDQDVVLGQAKALLADTDDSTVSARIWMTIADIHYRKERWEEALLAYLEVPVFYGSQTTVVPAAELMAARVLTRMQRFEDAVGFYQRIAQAYPGSSTAELAAKEMAVINGRPNAPDIMAAKAPKEGDAAAKPATEAKPEEAAPKAP